MAWSESGFPCDVCARCCYFCVSTASANIYSVILLWCIYMALQTFSNIQTLQDARTHNKYHNVHEIFKRFIRWLILTRENRVCVCVWGHCSSALLCLQLEIALLLNASAHSARIYSISCTPFKSNAPPTTAHYICAQFTCGSVVSNRNNAWHPFVGALSLCVTCDCYLIDWF